MGKIAVEGMHFYAHHGFYQEEQVIGGQYKVDVYLEFDFELAGKSDNLEQTVNYERVYVLVKEVMQERSKLIEHVASRIIDRISAELQGITKVMVRVNKMNPPLKGNVERVYVELEKEL